VSVAAPWLLDIARHQPTFFSLGIRSLEAGKIHVGVRQRDASGRFILQQPLCINSIDLIEVNRPDDEDRSPPRAGSRAD
jgi:hypothetical protein